MAESLHPEWVAVGATVRVVRTSFTGRVDHEHTATVTRHTPKGIATDDGSRFRKDGDEFVMTPRYCDYRTVLAPANYEET